MDRVLRVLAVVSLVVSACGPEVPSTGAGAAGSLAPEAAAAASEALRLPSHHPRLELMTRNLYLGAEITAIVGAQDPVAVATQIWGDVQRTDFPARAEVLADEIFWARPDVLGLQEVTLYRSGPPDVCQGLATPSSPVARHVELDFLSILQKELHRRGLHYDVAAQVTTMDVELCIFDPSRKEGVGDLRYTDRDVLLVRKDVRWRDPPPAQPVPGFVPAPIPPGPGDRNGGVYAVAVETGVLEPPRAPATAFFRIEGVADPVFSWRGWTAVEVERDGHWVRVFETHVEDRLDLTKEGLDSWYFQALQDTQLLALVDGANGAKALPTVVLGDFNVYRQESEPVPATFALLTSGVLRDAWTALRPPNDWGPTWGFDPDLRGGELFTTLDLVLATDDLEPLFTYRVGVHDRTRGGLHPSDHAGLVTAFQIR
jgi:hypothetical protein